MAVQTTEEFKNGGATSYTITIEYLKASDIKVRIGGALQTYTTGTPGSGEYSVSGTTVTLGAAAPSGSGNVHIYRETDVNTAAAVFAAGSSIRAADLNAIHDMARFGLSEARSTTIESDIKDGAITSSKIKDDTIVNADINASAAIAGTKVSPNFGSQNIVTTGTGATGNLGVTGNITVSGTVDGRDVATDGSKLDGIEAGATANQTNAEIRSAVEAATDSNVFTDADHTKLNGIETGATADQTASEIKTLYEDSGNSNASYIKTQYESNSNTNAYTDAEKTKLSGIETAATADQTGAEIKTAYEAESNTNAFTDAEKTKLSGIATGADVTSSNSINALTDVNTSGVADGKILKYQASSSSFIIADDTGGSQGATTFTGLTDTPANYGSAANKTLKVNSSGNAVEFVDVTTSFTGLTDTPTNFTGSANKTVKVNSSANALEFVDVTTSFVGLTDTPANFTGSANKTVKVNSSANALEFVDVNTDLVNDTTPQLGGPLDTNSEDVLFNTTGGTQTEKARWSASQDSFNLADGTGIKFGNHTQSGATVGDVSMMYVNGQDFHLQGSYNGSGDIVIGHGNSSGNTVPVVKAIRASGTAGGGNAELYFGGVKKFETTTGGVSVTGAGSFTTGVSAESFTTNAGNIIINSTAPTVSFVDSDANSDYEIKVNGGVFDIRDSTNTASRFSITSAGEVNSQGKLNCQAGLDTDGDVQFNSGTTNMNILWDASDKTLEFYDNVKIGFGADGDDFEIYHDATDNIIQAFGSPKIRLRHSATDGSNVKNALVSTPDGSVELYHNNSKKLETSSSGVTVTGTVAATSFTGDGTNLTGIASTVAGGAIYENSQTISSNHTIPVGSNGMSAGPVTVNNGITLTISSGSTYTVV